MIGLVKRHRERKTWEQRARRHVAELVADERQHLEVPLVGLPRQREQLLELYRRLLEPVRYRAVDVVKADDMWTAHFEKEAES